MPTYELYKNRFYDFVFQVEKDREVEFLKNLYEIDSQTKESLEENPDGMNDQEDSHNPYPNMTFTSQSETPYNTYVRRNMDLFKTTYLEEACSLDEDEEILRKGIVLPQIPYYDSIEYFDWEAPNFDFGVTYNICIDLGDDNCECEYRSPDYSSLPPDTTPELVEFACRLVYTQNISDYKNFQGTFFGAFAFSMEASAANRLRETLPADMIEYMEKMCSFHAVYHDNEDDNLDGCEAWVILNVPVQPDNNDSDDYDDRNILMGTRFVRFLNENSSDLEDYGKFCIYFAPQPGIVKAWDYGDNMFTTTWPIVDFFCARHNRQAAKMWGFDPCYYTDEPFHMQLQCYIYVNPEEAAKDGETTANQDMEAENTKVSGDSDVLHEKAVNIFPKVCDFAAPYGFHFSYSPESAWKKDTEFLILTTNPSASDGKKRAKKIIPDSPWPVINDFFNPDNKFNIQKTVQGICYELSRFAPDCSGYAPMESAKFFADNNAILASFVPFRTKEIGDITAEMTEFAKTEYWGKIFSVWQPRIIVTLGNPPYEAMNEFLSNRYTAVKNIAEKISTDGNLSYRFILYQKRNGELVTLIGLPHPGAFGEKGFPVNFPENAGQDTPLRKFFEKVKTEIRDFNGENDSPKEKKVRRLAKTQAIIEAARKARLKNNK